MAMPNNTLKSNSENLKNPDNRIHGIDALRAIAMILGMLLHATIAYKVEALPAWPQDKEFNHWAFDFLYTFVHSFRMPLFFLIAGYFSRLMYYKIGEQSFLKHRFKRIAVPFIFSLIFILPFTFLPFSIYRYSITDGGNWNKILEHSLRSIFTWKGLGHLWFLYYLLIYYVIVIVIGRLSKIPRFFELPARISSFLAFFTVRFGGMVLFIALTWLILLTSPGLYFHVDTGILPHVAYLLFYAVFFVHGWLINKNPIAFTWISKRFWLFIGLGISLCTVLFFLEGTDYLDSGTNLLFIKLIAAAQINFLVYGVIGFFLRFCHSENGFWRYISDASYWMYLIHLGLIAGLQVYFMNTALPGILRFLLVLIIPIIITLVTYHYFVRYTIVGTYLHGKRKKTD